MISEKNDVGVDERVVLQKFEGEPLPENEFERITIQNGEVVSHDRVEQGEVVGPVEDSELVGKDIGRLMSENNTEGDD